MHKRRGISGWFRKKPKNEKKEENHEKEKEICLEVEERKYSTEKVDDGAPLIENSNNIEEFDRNLRLGTTKRKGKKNVSTISEETENVEQFVQDTDDSINTS
jgi:hypothetical protein